MVHYFSPQKIRIIKAARSNPPSAVSLNELAALLEIDLRLGRRSDFRRRLQRALNDACVQGTMVNARPKRAVASIHLVRKPHK